MAYTRLHLQAKPELYAASNARVRAKISAVVRKAKDRPCADCGIRYPYYVMDFDHQRDKKFQLSRASATMNLTATLAEIEKCEVVCANCHRIRTHTSR